MLVRHLTKNVKYHKRQNVYIYRRFLLFSRNTSVQKKRVAVFLCACLNLEGSGKPLVINKRKNGSRI